MFREAGGELRQYSFWRVKEEHAGSPGLTVPSAGSERNQLGTESPKGYPWSTAAPKRAVQELGGCSFF